MHDSHIRLRAVLAPLPRAADILFLDAQELLAELDEERHVLSASLGGLQVTVAEVGKSARDPSARAALATLASRLAELVALRDALADVHEATVDPRTQRLASPDAPLAEYMRGLYAWSHAVVRALEHLAVGLANLEPDWTTSRRRLEHARNFHFHELHPAVRADLQSLRQAARGGSFGEDIPAVQELDDAVEALFARATALEARLAERFG